MSEASSSKKTTSKQTKQSMMPPILQRVVAGTSVYIVEFLVMHVALALLLISSIGLFYEIIEDVAVEADSFTSLYSNSASDLATYISLAVVALPLFLVLYARIRASERAVPALLELRSRRRLAYLFTTVVGLIALGYFIALVNIGVNQVLDTASGYSALPRWAEALNYAFAVLALLVSAAFVIRNLPQRGDAKGAK